METTPTLRTKLRNFILDSVSWLFKSQPLTIEQEHSIEEDQLDESEILPLPAEFIPPQALEEDVPELFVQQQEQYQYEEFKENSVRNGAINYGFKFPIELSERDNVILGIVKSKPLQTASEIGSVYAGMMGYKPTHYKSTGSCYASRSLKKLLLTGKVTKNEQKQYQ